VTSADSRCDAGPRGSPSVDQQTADRRRGQFAPLAAVRAVCGQFSFADAPETYRTRNTCYKIAVICASKVDLSNGAEAWIVRRMNTVSWSVGRSVNRLQKCAQRRQTGARTRNHVAESRCSLHSIPRLIFRRPTVDDIVQHLGL
jgi:hypothetical protein